MATITEILAADKVGDSRADINTNFSNLNTDKIEADSTDTLTNKTIDANGTGNAISNIDVADLSDGTDGELITWGADAAPTTVAVGTSGQVLTSNGAGAAPTFQAASGGTPELLGQIISLYNGVVITGLCYEYIVDSAITIAEVDIQVSTAPTGDTLDVDIRNNGTASTNSIFTSDTPVSISASGTTGNSTAIDNGSVTAGNPIYIYVTQVGSTIAGAGLKIKLK